MSQQQPAHNAPKKHTTSTTAAKATAVADAIGAIKWVLIALAVTVAIVSALAAVLERPGSTALTVSLVITAGTALWVLFTWVLFGWFEHTLRALAEIARNTGARES